MSELTNDVFAQLGPNSYLGALLAEAERTFWGEPVQELIGGTVNEPVTKEVAVTIDRAMEHVLLRRFGRGEVNGNLRLQEGLRKLNPELAGSILNARGEVTFPVLVTSTVQQQVTNLMLTQTAAWILMQLVTDPEIRRVNEWRYEHREDLAFLRENLVPAPELRLVQG